VDYRISRGEIHYVCLDPVFGREIGGFKMRPVLVLSINDINDRTRLITVVPGTGTVRDAKSLPNVVIANPQDSRKLRGNGLTKPTDFQCHQVRALEKGRFTQQAVAEMSPDRLAEIENAVAFCLGLPV